MRAKEKDRILATCKFTLFEQERDDVAMLTGELLELEKRLRLEVASQTDPNPHPHGIVDDFITDLKLRPFTDARNKLRKENSDLLNDEFKGIIDRLEAADGNNSKIGNQIQKYLKELSESTNNNPTPDHKEHSESTNNNPTPDHFVK